MATNDSMDNLLEQAKKMQDRMQQMQDELNAVEITGEAGGGLVKVIINGRYYAKQVKLDPKLRSESDEMVAELIAAAFNAAVKSLEEKQQEKVKELAKGMGLPNTNNMGGGGMAV